MTTKVRIVNPASNYKEKSIQSYETELVDIEGRFAMALLERWGPVNSKVTREDSSGQAIVEPLSPEETVDRAFEIASLTFSKLRKKGLIVHVPDLEEINKDITS
jgi:hypothetical protein